MNKKIPQSFKCITLFPLKRKSHQWIIEISRFKNESQAVSCWRQHESLAYCPPTCWCIGICLNENANSFFATRCHSCFLGNAVHKAALQTLLYQALHARLNANETNRTNHHRLATRKGGVWKNESLSESFGSHWAGKVWINAYYKTMKVLFDLACMSTCCWGLLKPKYEPFIAHNRSTLRTVHSRFFGKPKMISQSFSLYKSFFIVGNIL